MELSLYLHHVHGSMDTHCFCGICSHTGLPRSAKYLRALHSTPGITKCYTLHWTMKQGLCTNQLSHVGCSWLAGFLSSGHPPPQVIVMVQQSLLDLLSDLVGEKLAASLGHLTRLELTHGVAGGDVTVLLQPWLGLIVHLEPPPALQSLIAISAANWSTTAAATKG